jgi:hypothetical protein
MEREKEECCKPRMLQIKNMKIKNYLLHHKRFGIIIAGIIVLNVIYGFDARFNVSSTFCDRDQHN